MVLPRMENKEDVLMNGCTELVKPEDVKENQKKDAVKPSSKRVSSEEDLEDTESDALVEFQLNNLVHKSQISDFDIRNHLVRCSACGKQINHHETSNFRRHRRLGVITCCECYEFYGSSEFSQDESGVYNYCHWCGQGGKLIICDYCPNGFCSACIRRNFGRAEVSVTEREGWKCYCCNPQRLKPKQRYFRLIRRYVKGTKKQREKKTLAIAPSGIKDTVSPPWMLDAFQQVDSVCVSFKKKMDKLKGIESTRSKSLYHVIKKMEEIMNHHKKDLKSVMKVVTGNYSKYLSKQKLEINGKSNDRDSSSDVVEIYDSPPRVDEKPVMKDEAPEKKLSRDVQQVTQKSELSAVSDILNETLEKVTSNFNLENEKAKMMLLDNTSSESESKSVDETRPAPASCRRRRLDFSSAVQKSGSPSSSYSSLSESEKERASFKPTNSNNDSQPSYSEKCISAIDYDDLKLRGKAIVVLERCNELNFFITSGSEPKPAVEASPKSEELKNLERLERVIANLEKFPEIKKKEIADEKPVKSAKPSKSKPKVSKAEKNGNSSSSICFSSENEDAPEMVEDKPKSKPLDLNLLARNELMETDSSSSSSNSDDEVTKKKKKGKSEKKPERSDEDFRPASSEDDFRPSKKKKKKHDRLLSARIRISDDSDEPRERTSRGKRSTKRKAIESDEDGERKEKTRSSTEHTTTSDSEEERDNRRQKRKLKRIKKMKSSSSSDAEGKDQDGTPGKGRKNIKKIISQKKLTEETKEAQLAEKERKKRISEKQKLYNKIEDMAADGKEVITRKLVLEVDPTSKEELVEISPDLIEKLKVHQVNGVRFMWECTIESLKDLEEDKPGSGCILAHCMGLGKTLQVITFLHTCMTNKRVKKKIKTAMVVCPYNTILNWANEFEMWLDGTEGHVQVHQFSAAKDNWARLDILKWWQREGGVLIISYDIMRRLVAAPATKKVKSKVKNQKKFFELLIDPGPDIVVCDEGHVLKNVNSAISKAMSPMKSQRRIVLTGTPLQNNLQEYHCMLSFVKPHLLGTAKEFRNRFVHPIQNGQYENSTQYDVKLMKKRTHILHKLLDGCVQRCDYSSLTKFLPPKHEFVISVKLSDVQIKMYRHYLDKVSNASKSASKGATLFQDVSNLRCIWTHPFICRTSFERSEHRRMLNEWKDEGEDESFINDDSEEESAKSTSDEGANDKESSGEEVVKKYSTRSRRDKDGEIGEAAPKEEEEEEKQWFDSYITAEDRYRLHMSGKMILLVEILNECEAIGDKVIVFSTSLLTLDMIEDVLGGSDSEDQTEESSLAGSFIKGRDYFRMDGSTSADFRKTYIDMFNNPDNDRARLFLISTRAGGLGTNLVGANRVILLDASWNPSDDVQAIFRVYRFGQQKPVYIYRLLAQGTMEEKIYDRQITKLSLSFRVVDEQQIDRHFSAADLAELYTFNPEMTSNRPTPLVPKDRLLAELLIKKKDWIVTYHEHDSLLQNETEEDLTEEERQAAWNEYENEREGKVVEDSFLSGFDCKEPDSELADYEGNLLPNVQHIFSTINSRLEQQFPGSSQRDFMYQTVESLEVVRAELQVRQVKYLRMKQEFFSKGSVPNFVNKYLEELTSLIKNLNVFVHRVRQHLQGTAAATAAASAANKAPQAQNQWNSRNAQQEYVRAMNLQRLQEQLRSQMQGGARFPAGVNFMPRSFPMFVRMRMPSGVQIRMVQPRPPQAEPIVTEEEEGAGASSGTASNPSSVTIEEIS